MGLQKDITVAVNTNTPHKTKTSIDPYRRPPIFPLSPLISTFLHEHPRILLKKPSARVTAGGFRMSCTLQLSDESYLSLYCLRRHCKCSQLSTIYLYRLAGSIVLM